MKNNFHRILGLTFIALGLIFYPTPVPGTTFLVIFGFVYLIGKDKTLKFFHKILSHKLFKSLRIKRIVKKL